MSLTWFYYWEEEERLPFKRMTLQIVLLVAFGSMTNAPALLLVVVILSALIHLHVDLWEPIHTGIVAGAFAVGIVTLHGITLGYSPVEWINGTGNTEVFASAGIATAVAACVAHMTGNPIERYLDTSPFGSRKYENATFGGEHPYGTYSPEFESKNRETQWQTDSTSTVGETGSDTPASQPTESNDKSEAEQSNHNHSINPAESDPEPDIDKEKLVKIVQQNAEEALTEEDADSTEEYLDEGDEDDEDTGIESFAYPWEEPPEVRFEDIGGYNDVKEELSSQVINPLQSDSESYDRFDVEPSRGLLFQGPPGTGKTLFARAIANALDRPFVELTQADLTHEYINKSPQLIKRLFEEAQHLGGVVFIDEAEQLLSDRTRGENAHAEDQKVTNMFLSALTKEEQDFILLLTTNQRDGMDEAILRPGRIDCEFEIGLPDIKARTEILKLTVLDVPHKLTEDHVKRLAEHTDGWSGADLEALANQAKLKAAEQDAKHLEWRHIKLGYTEVITDSEDG